jgi:hypothetical protein
MRLYYRIRNTISDAWWRFRRNCQRFKRGYAYGDVWNMLDWFMDMAKPMLIHLRDYGIGIPQDLYVDGDNERINWENVLTEMINCLDLMDEEKVYEYLGFGDYDSWKRMTADDYKNVGKIMEENKNRFFELFSKYFFSLWD